MHCPEEEILKILNRNAVDFTASLPCEKIKTLLEMVEMRFQHIPLTREEEGVGICAGAALSGRRPAMFVQSSGIGNMINALLSLTSFYELPLALFVSRRGVYKEKIEAQFPMGQKLPAILSGAGIPWTEINGPEDIGKIDRELAAVYTNNRIHAFLMSPQVWEHSECRIEDRPSETESLVAAKPEPWILDAALHDRPETTPTLTRHDIILAAAPFLEGKVIVSNLGWPSKELYAIKHQPSNFYMFGSMGMATPIGLGISLTASNKEVVVIDGDGSLLMNPGTLATAASFHPKKLMILAIDNGAYGSTGNQPTLARKCVDLELLAIACGFVNTAKLTTQKEIRDAIKDRRKSMRFAHALAVPGNSDVPNIPVHHLQIKRTVQEFLKA